MYYLPHHKRLQEAVKQQLDEQNWSVILDCHSFPSFPLPYESDQSLKRPDICIGTDSFHTPEWLTEEIVRLFQDIGYSIAVNRPFSGSLVPIQYYRLNKRLFSIMIEINRKLYMDEESWGKNSRYEVLQFQLAEIIHRIKRVTEKHFDRNQNGDSILRKVIQ